MTDGVEVGRNSRVWLQGKAKSITIVEVFAPLMPQGRLCKAGFAGGYGLSQSSLVFVADIINLLMNSPCVTCCSTALSGWASF